MVPEFLTKKVTLVVPSWISLILALGAVGLILWFIKAPMQRNLIIYITSVIAGTGVILTAITAIITMQAQSEQAERTLNTQKELAQSANRESNRREAFDLMKRWNDPLFARLRHEIAAGIEVDEKFVTLKSEPVTLAKVNLILNFLELVAVGCKNGDVDPELCKLYFRSALFYYEKRLTWYMDEWIRGRNQPTAWENLRELARSWSS